MKSILTVFGLLLSACLVAAPVPLDFVFEDANTGARAVGTITVDDDFLINPTDGSPNRGLGGSGFL